MKGIPVFGALFSAFKKQTAFNPERIATFLYAVNKQPPLLLHFTYFKANHLCLGIFKAFARFSTMDEGNTSGDSLDQHRDKKLANIDGKTASLSRDNTSKLSGATTTSTKPLECNHSTTSYQYQQQINVNNSDNNQSHHYHSNFNSKEIKDMYNQSTDQEKNRNTIITSVERPLPTTELPRITSPAPVTKKQPSNNTNSTPVYNNHDTSTFPVIISRLQELQSPPPQPTARESPITQVPKTRHRGFLSQLLCCFRPTSSNICHYSNSIYNNTDVSQHHSSLTQKYSGKYLLPARKPSDNRICLVIDLDETLVHSSFKPIENADFIVPVEIDGTLHKVYVLKRPHVDEFLKRMGKIYECVLFTASLSKYADPVADLLDTENIFKARLFRESCAFYRGNYVKDLSRLGRDLNRVIIVDNSPASYIFHPDNAVSIKPALSLS